MIDTEPSVQASSEAATDGTPRRSLPYMPGLDGLRAVAVIAVLLYHADLMWIPGGFLGVEVFFVISGYLITSLLLREHERTDTVGFRAFWGRRARRLLPALFALLLGTAVYVALFLPQEVARLRGDYAAAFTYVTNWYLILKQESYFEAMGRPSLLKHLWSLAVEEQFYIIWPVLFAGGMALLKRRGFLLAIVAAALGSTALMWALYEPLTDPSRVYYGTDTRAAGLLVGAALAFVWQPWRVHDSDLGSARLRAIDLVGTAGLAVVVALFLLVSEYGDFLYRGGFLVLSVATAGLIAATVHPAAWVGRVMGVAPLRWIGLRSYSIYLWHWPVFVVTRPGIDVQLYGWQSLALRLAATVVLADLSYRLVEGPFRRRDIDRWTAALRSRLSRAPTGPAVEWAMLAAVPVAVFLVLSAASVAWSEERHALLSAVSPDDPWPIMATASVEQELGAPEPGELPTGAPATATDSRSDPDTVAATPPPTALLREAGPGTVGPRRFATPDRLALLRATGRAKAAAAGAGTAAADDGWSWDQAEPAADRTAAALDALLRSPPESRSAATQAALRSSVNPGIKQVTFIGDSVLLSAEYALTEVFGPAARIDATVSRQFYSAIDTVRFLRDTGQLTDAVVIHLGNNGAVNDQQFDDMMEALQGVEHIYFVTVKVPRRWEGVVNEALHRGVERHPEATLIDWHDISSRRPELFREDGVHLVPEGARFYAELIALSL